MKKILFFEIKYLCHKSNNLFVSKLKKELKKEGHSVEICNIIDRNDMGNKLNSYIGKKYDALIDFNSILPSVEMDEGGYFIDKIDAPFYNYIVDHPLFHHDNLKIGLKNYNVICIDNNHKKYIDKYYPHIKKCFVLPLAPTRAMIKTPFEDRKIEILYPNSYMPLKEAKKRLHNRDKETIKLAYEVFEIVKENPEITQEEALKRILEKKNKTLDIYEFREQMYYLYSADIYTRCYFREKMIDCLLEAGNTVTVCGKGWDEYEYSGNNLIRFPDVSYTTALQYMQNSKMVVNVTPGFKCGIHDRVTSAMLNGAVTVTDTSVNSNCEFDVNEGFFDFSSFLLENKGLICYNYLEKNMIEVSNKIYKILNDKTINFSTDLKENHDRIRKLWNWKKSAEFIAKNIV